VFGRFEPLTALGRNERLKRWAHRAPAPARRVFCRAAASGWCSAGN